LNGNETGYFSFFNIRKLTTAKTVNLEKTLEANQLIKQMAKIPNLNISFYERLASSPSSSTLDKWHRGHLEFCTSVTQQIVNNLLSLKVRTKKKLIVNIEFYSYGSTGSSSYQIAEFTGILKMLLLKEDICLPDDIHVIPGPSIKMFAGKGNFDKFDMLHVYRELNIDNNKDEFAKFIIKNFDQLYKEKTVGKGSSIKKEVPSPYSDIIDSWWIAKYLEKELAK
jgi:hypothetical protein